MKNYVTLPHSNLTFDSTAMATLTFTINVPDNKSIDVEALKLQVEAFVTAVVSVPNILKKEETEDMSFFNRFDNDWSDDPRDSHEIAEELHNNRINTRTIAEQ